MKEEEESHTLINESFKINIKDSNIKNENWHNQQSKTKQDLSFTNFNCCSEL